MPDAGMRKRVEAIPGTPLPHGLLGGCVPQRRVTDPHELLGIDWVPTSCADALCWEWCPPGESPGDTVKEFNRPGVCTAPPVTVYAGVECNPIGFPYDEARAHAIEALNLGESRALEQWVMGNLLCEMATDHTPPDGPVSIAQGLATIEGWLAVNYGGIGLIHVPAGMGALLGDLVHREGDCLVTLTGNRVVIGAGYSANIGPGCVPGDEGTGWLYATGPALIRRENVDVVPPTDAESVRTTVNDRLVLAERTSVVQFACCTAEAVQVTVCGCC